MKNQSLLLLATFFSISVFSQQTRFYTDPEEKFKEAKEYFQKGQFSLAYPLFKELKQSIRETDKANTSITVQEINYYTTVCALKQGEGRAESEAQEYIDIEKNTARTQMMSYHLGEYYFAQQQFAEAAAQYEQTNIANLSNREIADMKFHQGYSYFTLQRFNEAKPLFNSIRSIKDDPNYIDANYYYGFLAFRDRQYSDALAAFKIVENEKSYGTVVPYYIAQVYYIQGKKDEAITYIQQKLQSGSSSQYYDLELKQLIGHAYFEKKEYAKALPYLEDYVGRSKKVRREDLYELSYCYYQANNFSKAIDGFKQLSGKDDSLSQHAMYLLGDAYLKTGQKSNARNAFLFCSSNSSNAEQKEISKYQYAKLSYELGYQDEALNSLSAFLADYPASTYTTEAKELMIAMLANTNNYKDAQALLEGLTKPSENAKRLYPRILYGRATELINDGRLAEADALLDKALADPNNGSVLPLLNFWKGELAYRNNKLDDAIKYYHEYVKGGSPTSGEANLSNVNYNLGYCYLRKENYPVALSYFEPLGRNATISSNSFVQDAFIRTADCYYMQKDYTRAKTMYDNVVKFSWPAEDYATFQNAMLAGVKSPKEKISLMNTMIRKFPASSLVTDANMEIANTYMSDEKFSEAIPYLSAVAKTSGNASLVPQAYLKMGTSYYNLNNNGEALRQFKILIDKYPNSPEAEDALDNIKTIYIEDGKPEEYAGFMRDAGRPLSVSTEDSLTYAAAEKRYDDQDMNGALTGFNNYLQKFPNGVYALDANFNRAEIYNSKKDWNNALVGYDMVAANAPNRYAERAVLTAARINFFELKNYVRAESFYIQLKQITASQENKLEAMRGLLRSQYQQQKWTEAVENAKELTEAKGSSADDKTLANMAIAKSYQVGGQYDLAIANFKSVVQLNKAALAAEARYEIANCWFQVNKLNEAEKAAFETINKSGSYDYWVTKGYILLGDIYFRQKDYFNAKATFQSIVDNTINAELKNEAQEKLSRVTEEEGKSSKVNN
ncbi:MAG: tetratricopeptide repeat protein [Chitinophagaceae bacterium]|jgi:TolA-binding protein|nr:tetratricopeptide repeat protein [Chitinophagaceae bacterium]MBK8301533.1 tetratricopeptide repeat protein [Chitinophagaceae bacterium]MBK9464569.1 tetratricopeptide repeat protein [Chitinophagaceae bacterium]MBK9939221.1 tetratricopeptide repeat protein [Chitinophagaceae bacterium]MBP6415085.1 tetratricopeptide repeat protein [Chitinophagaceae bacterium]